MTNVTNFDFLKSDKQLAGVADVAIVVWVYVCWSIDISKKQKPEQ